MNKAIEWNSESGYKVATPFNMPSRLFRCFTCGGVYLNGEFIDNKLETYQKYLEAECQIDTIMHCSNKKCRRY